MRRLLKLTKSIDSDPLDTIKEVISSAQKVLYDKDKSYITYQEIVDDDSSEVDEIYKAALSLEKPPVEIPLGKDSKEFIAAIFGVFVAANIKGLFVSHILIRNLSTLHSIFRNTEIKSICNVKVQETENLENDVLLFIISSQKQAELPDFKFVVKGELDV